MGGIRIRGFQPLITYPMCTIETTLGRGKVNKYDLIVICLKNQYSAALKFDGMKDELSLG